MSHEGRIRVAAICGSVRPGNYTRTHLLDYIRQNVCPRIQLERIVREGAA